ncbi:uncharacterized protein LOC119364949 isoform X3 [Triticum dicoccoides]|uniref:uncharacterized protein LOC119364949 isoform X3 n=1 Tax=Triticum dicoccoides TaxID=85692 RepID=UPI00188E5E2A|nr:uncharacterized protein LOC119364949 isoform X3 [Triticum dicoccoides]
MTTRKAGARLPGRVHGIHDYWAEGRQGGEGEKKGQRKSGAERRRPELAGAGRWRTGAGDGGKAGARRSRAMADGRGRRRDPVRGLVPTTTAAWPREDSTRRRAGAAQEQPWMLRVQGVQGRFGVVPSQAPAIPHLSRCSASRLFSSVAGRFPRRYRKRGSNNSVQQQQHLQGGLGSGCAPRLSQPSRGAPEITT